MIIFGGGFVFLPCAVLIVLLACVRFSFLIFISAFFGRARKRPKGQIRHTLQAKNVFLRCTLAPALPQGRQPMVKRDFKNRMEKRQTIIKKHEISGSRRRPPKKAPKMTSRRLPGTLREPPGRARRGPRGAKRAPRRPQEPPRAPPRAAQRRPPGAPLAPKRLQEGFGNHFGSTQSTAQQRRTSDTRMRHRRQVLQCHVRLLLALIFSRR